MAGFLMKVARLAAFHVRTCWTCDTTNLKFIHFHACLPFLDFSSDPSFLLHLDSKGRVRTVGKKAAAENEKWCAE